MKHIKELDQSDIEMAIRQYVQDNDVEADSVTIKIRAAYNGSSLDSEPASVSATVTMKDREINPIRAQWGDLH